jgi:hypothetical protein
MWRETVLRLRARAGEIAQFLLGYRPPPEAPQRRPGSRLAWLAWLASAGGYGALETYSAGAFLGLGLSLALVSYSLWTDLVAGGADDDVSALPIVLVAILLYLTVTGFVVGLRRRRISHAAIVGAVTAILGVGMAYVSFVVISIGVYRQAIAIAVLPSLLPFLALGFLCGALGGAIALPGAAYRAIRDGLREP